MENVSIENIIKGLMLLSVISLVVQFLVERVKHLTNPFILQHWRKYTNPVFAAVIGVIVAYLLNLGFFESLGILSTHKHVDMIFTGLATSASSVPINNLIKKFEESRGNNQNEKGE